LRKFRRTRAGNFSPRGIRPETYREFRNAKGWRTGNKVKVKNGGLAGKFLFADEGKSISAAIYTRRRLPLLSLSLSLSLPLRGMHHARNPPCRLPSTRFPVFCIFFLPRASVSPRLEFPASAKIGSHPACERAGIYAEMEIARYSIAQNVPGYARSFPDNCVTLSRNGVDTESTIIALPRFAATSRELGFTRLRGSSGQARARARARAETDD